MRGGLTGTFGGTIDGACFMAGPCGGGDSFGLALSAEADAGPRTSPKRASAPSTKAFVKMRWVFIIHLLDEDYSSSGSSLVPNGSRHPKPMKKAELPPSTGQLGFKLRIIGSSPPRSESRPMRVF
jgi:hypothetical protein